MTRFLSLFMPLVKKIRTDLKSRICYRLQQIISLSLCSECTLLVEISHDDKVNLKLAENVSSVWMDGKRHTARKLQRGET